MRYLSFFDEHILFIFHSILESATRNSWSKHFKHHRLSCLIRTSVEKCFRMLYKNGSKIAKTLSQSSGYSFLADI